MNGQMSLFSAEELLEGQNLLEHEAKLYVLKVILRSCSNRKRIREALNDGDVDEARKWFADSFRTFGFASPRSYSFRSYRDTATIRYYHEGVAHEFEEKLNPLFRFLLENYSTVKDMIEKEVV